MKHFISANGFVAEVTDDMVVVSGPDDMTLTDAITDPADNPRLSVADMQEFLDD